MKITAISIQPYVQDSRPVSITTILSTKEYIVPVTSLPCRYRSAEYILCLQHGLEYLFTKYKEGELAITTRLALPFSWFPQSPYSTLDQRSPRQGRRRNAERLGRRIGPLSRSRGGRPPPAGPAAPVPHDPGPSGSPCIVADAFTTQARTSTDE